jgi:hypothetical protein
VGVTRRPAASEAPAFSRHHDPLRSVSNRAREFLSNPLIGREGDSLAIHELEEYFVFPVPQIRRPAKWVGGDVPDELTRILSTFVDIDANTGRHSRCVTFRPPT